MLTLIAILLNSFVCPGNFVMNASYVQEQQDEEIVQSESNQEEDGVVLLSYNPSEKQARVIKTSAPGDALDEPGTDDDDAGSVTSGMDDDFANMRIMQLANTIAEDMGFMPGAMMD